MSGFDFAGAFASEEVFSPATETLLPKGNHLVQIKEVSDDTSSTGKPMIGLRLEGVDGYQRDRLVVSPASFPIQKILGLFAAAGVSPPTADQVNQDDGRIAEKKLLELNGKHVGIVVRDEEDNRYDHKGEFWPRVQGYVHPSMLPGQTDLPADTTGLPVAAGVSSSPADDDIPF